MPLFHPPRDNNHIIGPQDRVNLLKSRSRKHTRFKIGSFNVQGGLKGTLKCSQVLEDMKRLDISICALQETKAKDIIFLDHNYGRILGFPSDTPYYGLAFGIRKNLQVHSAECVSDRIAVISVFLNNQRTKDTRPSLLTVINAYAPHSERARLNPEEANLFYQQLQITTHKYRYSTLLYIAGDFNAKIGRKLDDSEFFMGNFSKKYGSRNSNGDLLAHFAASNNLFLTNTAFRHPSRHISTWHGFIQGKNYHNQIDYILCRSNNAHILTNARSYRGTITQSDHSIVVTTINFTKYYQHVQLLHRQKPLHKIFKPSTLAESIDLQNNYQSSLQNLLKDHPINSTLTPNEQYAQLRGIIHSATSATLPQTNRRNSSHPHYFDDPEIKSLSERLKAIKLLFNQPSTIPYPPGITRQDLCRERQQIKKRILDKQFQLHSNRIDNIANRLDQCKKGQAALQFELSRQLLNNKRQPFQLRDETTNHPIITSNAQIEVIRNHYNNFFNQVNYAPVVMFTSSINQFIPITEDEVSAAIKRLSNGRTKDSDNLYGEFFKYGCESIKAPICNIINTIFLTQTRLDSTQISELFCLNKPKGTSTVKNLRPITLMSIIRKIMEIIILNQIYPTVDAYISPNQSARRNRSTADIIWTYQFQTAFAERYNKEIYFLGIDLTNAFDTVDRNLLLDTLTPIVPPSSLVMLRYLMADTSLKVKLGKDISEPFPTIHGIPQGGALSTLLFAAYMEAPLQLIRRDMIQLFNQPTTTLFDTEYVDDCDFITNDLNLLHSLDVLLPTYLSPWKLIINQQKTEKFRAFKGSQASIPKLGSNIQPYLDIKAKCIKATIAFKKLSSLWFRSHLVSQAIRVKIYNAYVTPILLYNLHAAGLTQAHLNILDVFHRKQLRMILRVHYPAKISNKALYRNCRTAPISIMLLENRWKLFGHVLRLPVASPPQLSMKQYYINDKTCRGTPRTTLPVSLHRELLEYTQIKVSSPEDLQWIRTMARDRSGWSNFTEVIITGANEKYDETRKRKRSSTAQDFTGTPGQHRRTAEVPRLTPLALDFRKRSIERLGSPYTTWYPSPTRRRYTNPPPTYMNE